MTVGGIDGWEHHTFEVQVESVEDIPPARRPPHQSPRWAPLRECVITRQLAESLPVGELTRWGAFWLADYAGNHPTSNELFRFPAFTRAVDGGG